MKAGMKWPCRAYWWRTVSRLHFPDDVLEDAARYPEGVDRAEVKKRRDMREYAHLYHRPRRCEGF